MISPESDGRLLTMKLPLHDITITKPDGARCFDRGHAMIDVHLDLLPHEVSDNGQVTTCLLVVDLEPQGGDDTAARLTDLRIEGHHSIEDAAYLRLALGTWLNANLDAFTHLGYPVLVGTSRKGFLGALLEPVRGQTQPKERDGATAATMALAVDRGASILRVHDVRLGLDVATIAKAMVRNEHHGEEIDRT